MSSGYASINHQEFPVVTVTFYHENPTPQEVSSYLKELEDLYLCGEKFVVIFDISLIKTVHLDTQQQYIAWLEQHHKRIRKSVVLNVYVLPSLVQRTMFNGFCLVKRPVVPFQVAKTLEEAQQIAQQTLGLDKKNKPIIPLEEFTDM
ncbi:MAG: hypothetical protein ACOVQA_12130 [Thermoflexibacteraceae bacterium]